MLTNVQSMRDGDLKQINTAQNRVEETPKNTQPIHPAPYRAGPKAYEFDVEEIDKMLSQKYFEPVQTELDAPIIFAKKGRTPTLLNLLEKGERQHQT